MPTGLTATLPPAARLRREASLALLAPVSASPAFVVVGTDAQTSHDTLMCHHLPPPPPTPRPLTARARAPGSTEAAWRMQE